MYLRSWVYFIHVIECGTSALRIAGFSGGVLLCRREQIPTFGRQVISQGEPTLEPCHDVCKRMMYDRQKVGLHMFQDYVMSEFVIIPRFRTEIFVLTQLKAAHLTDSIESSC